MDGEHTLERCREVTEEVLRTVFNQLYTQGVTLEGMILKPNMVLPGLTCPEQETVDEVADATVRCLLRAVPAAVPGIAFLSGGQSAELASARLNAMNVRFKSRLPWALAFSFGRAIQQPALEIWQGDKAHVLAAQQALYHRARCNRAAPRRIQCRDGNDCNTMRTYRQFAGWPSTGSIAICSSGDDVIARAAFRSGPIPSKGRTEEHAMDESLPDVYLARHGETAWSLSGRHTGRTDIPLTERGEDNARRLRGRLEGITFTEVLVSPLQRARRTCELAGFAAVAKVTPDLIEWDYGDYEGRLTSDIRRERPRLVSLPRRLPGGESLAAVGARADRVIARLRADGGRVLLFGHGHFSRVLAARWMGLTTEDARHLLLSTASLSIVGYEHTLDDPAILLWNDDHHANPGGQERLTRA